MDTASKCVPAGRRESFFSSLLDQLLEFGGYIGRESGTEAHLLVHCHAGVSRASASTALPTIAYAMPACPGRIVFAELLRITLQIQRNLRVVEIGDSMFGREGDLVTAAHGIYCRQVSQKPRPSTYSGQGVVRER